MTTPPERKPLDWERLLLIAGGHTAFQLLWAGVELGLYDTLSEHPGQDLDSVSNALGIGAYPARVLMVGLTALGVVELREGRYSNADLTEQRLVKGKPGYAAPILGWQAHIVYPGLERFVDALREERNVGLECFPGPGRTLYERLTVDKPREKVFQDAMSALSRQANSFLPRAVDFARFSNVVDAGGGDGTNAMSIARQHDGIATWVFDSASVCQLAQRNIDGAGMGDRVRVWAGDFFTDPFPPGTDCVLFCHILTIWSMQRNTQLLKRTWEAMPEGGAVVIFNMMAADDDSGPISTALGSPYFLAIATGEGMLHPWKDYEQALRAAGFRSIDRVDQGLPLDHGILIGTK